MKEYIRTYWVVFQHAHRRGRSRTRELVEEARHGHRDEAHRNDAGFHYCFGRQVRQLDLKKKMYINWESREIGAPFFAMVLGLLVGILKGAEGRNGSRRGELQFSEWASELTSGGRSDRRVT